MRFNCYLCWGFLHDEKGKFMGFSSQFPDERVYCSAWMGTKQTTVWRTGFRWECLKLMPANKEIILLLLFFCRNDL